MSQTDNPFLDSAGLGGSGQAAGSQAQFGIFLQLMQKITAYLEAAAAVGNVYTVYPWTAAGDLNIGTTYPSQTSGTFSIRQTTPAAINVTLPAGNGPWLVVDGNGQAAAHNITVKPPTGFTIQGTTSYVISTNWGAALFILDGTNYIDLK